MAAYLIDTTVLLRVVHKQSPEHATVVHAISTLLEQGEELFVTAQVLIEFWAVATRSVQADGFGWSSEMTKVEINHIISQFPLIKETEDVFAHWLKVVTVQGSRNKKVYDARLIAVMKANKVTHLLTFNEKAFRIYPEITAVHPEKVI